MCLVGNGSLVLPDFNINITNETLVFIVQNCKFKYKLHFPIIHTAKSPMSDIKNYSTSNLLQLFIIVSSSCLSVSLAELATILVMSSIFSPWITYLSKTHNPSWSLLRLVASSEKGSVLCKQS